MQLTQFSADSSFIAGLKIGKAVGKMVGIYPIPSR
jgi:hypothetical protein